MVLLTEELEEAVLAVGLVVLLFEGSFVELLEAEGTDKVFWVEFLAHGSDAASRDGLLAAGAERAAALVVMHLAVGLPIVLEEAAVDKRGETFLQQDKAKGTGCMRSWGGGEGQLYKRPLLYGTAQLCCGQVNCYLSALSCYPEPNSVHHEVSKKRLRNGQIQTQARELISSFAQLASLLEGKYYG